MWWQRWYHSHRRSPVRSRACRWRGPLDVDRGGALLFHPGQGRAVRVVGGAEIEDLGVRRGNRPGLLVDVVAVGDEAYGQAVGLSDRPGHRCRERPLVQGSRQLDVLRGEIHGVRRVESLRGPEAELGLGQGQAFAVGAHAHSPGRKPRPDLPVRWTGSWAGRAAGHADGAVGATVKRWTGRRVGGGRCVGRARLLRQADVRARTGAGMGAAGLPVRVPGVVVGGGGAEAGSVSVGSGAGSAAESQGWDR